MAKPYMRLDNSANIYPMLVNKQNQNLFRIAAELKEDINKVALSQAVNLVLPRFRCLTMKLMRGFFWYYLQDNDAPFVIEEESDVMLKNIGLNTINGYNFRMGVYRNRISLEFYHVVCDGSGALELLKSILHAYFMITHRPLPSDTIRTFDSTPTAGESEDGFGKNYKRLPLKDLKIKSLQGKKAFLIQGEYFSYGKTITRLVCNSHDILATARAHNTTVTALVTAIFGQALIDVYGSDNPDAQIMMPINLRKVFNSCTLRNFSLFSRVGLPFDKTLDDHIELIRQSLKRDMDKNLLENQIATSVRPSKMLPFRLMPLFLKRMIFVISNNFFGKGKRTATISNMGVVKMPEEYYEYVDNITFQVNSNKNTPMNIAMGSFGEKTTICFTSAIKECAIVEAYAKRLCALGLSVSADSNMWGLDK